MSNKRASSPILKTDIHDEKDANEYILRKMGNKLDETLLVAKLTDDKTYTKLTLMPAKELVTQAYLAKERYLSLENGPTEQSVILGDRRDVVARKEAAVGEMILVLSVLNDRGTFAVNDPMVRQSVSYGMTLYTLNKARQNHADRLFISTIFDVIKDLGMSTTAREALTEAMQSEDHAWIKEYHKPFGPKTAETAIEICDWITKRYRSDSARETGSKRKIGVYLSTLSIMYMGADADPSVFALWDSPAAPMVRDSGRHERYSSINSLINIVANALYSVDPEAALRAAVVDTDRQFRFRRDG